MRRRPQSYFPCGFLGPKKALASTTKACDLRLKKLEISRWGRCHFWSSEEVEECILLVLYSGHEE